jgi:uncharacterized protein
VEPQIKLSRSRVLRIVYGAIGFVFLGLGIAGFFVPGLPGTVNLLIALYFFSMSSERMHTWMLTNPMFGKQLREYKAGYGIPVRIKVLVVAAIVTSVCLSAFVLRHVPVVAGIVVVVGVVGVWFVTSRPTKERVIASGALPDPAIHPV